MGMTERVGQYIPYGVTDEMTDQSKGSGEHRDFKERHTQQPVQFRLSRHHNHTCRS